MRKKMADIAKRFLMNTLVGLFLVIILESVSYLGLAYIYQSFNVRDKIQRERAVEGPMTVGSIFPILPNAGGVDDEVIHPYFGYVSRHRTPQDMYGFVNAVSPVQKKSEDKVILAVLGGSVAEAMFRYGIKDMVAELKKSERFKDKEILPICLAMGGYKQPQQLMVMNYFLSVGGEFDIIVNLDGFNEITMPLTENRLVKVSSGFPREWRTRTDPLEPWAFKPILMIRAIKEIKYKTKRFFLTFPLSHSYTAMSIWKLLDFVLYNRLYHYHHEYFYDLPKKELAAMGPYREFLTQDELYSFMAHIWMKASQNIEVLSRANLIQYYHFLQPNLHLDGTKIWSKREIQFREGDSPYPIPVKKGYEKLKEYSRVLTKSGERYYDLTDIFKNHSETLYEDDCCHFRRPGSRLLAAEIGRIIASDGQSHV